MLCNIHLSASRLSKDLLQPTTISAVSLGGFVSLAVEVDDDDDVDADLVSFAVGGEESPPNRSIENFSFMSLALKDRNRNCLVPSHSKYTLQHNILECNKIWN